MSTLLEHTPFSVRYRGDKPLPVPATPGQFVVGDTGELHLGMGDGSYLRVGCCCCEWIVDQLLAGLQLSVSPTTDPTVLSVELTRTSILTEHGVVPGNFEASDFTVTGTTATNFMNVGGGFVWTFDLSAVLGDSITVTYTGASPYVSTKSATVTFDATPTPNAIWGLFYPTAPGATHPHPSVPTGQELMDLELEGVYDVDTNIKPNFVVAPAMNANDWTSTGTSEPFYMATAKLFVVVQTIVRRRLYSGNAKSRSLLS